MAKEWWVVKKPTGPALMWEHDSEYTYKHMLANSNTVERTLSPHEAARDVLDVFIMHRSYQMGKLKTPPVKPLLVGYSRRHKIPFFIQGAL